MIPDRKYSPKSISTPFKFETLPSIQRTTLPSLSQNSFTTAPFVTASSWAIHDFKTGELLWGRETEVKREVASLTKIMTCLLCHNLLLKFEKDPQTLSFPVDYSAASISGTHSGLREGDHVKVIDLLHGLMLPSGNDSALALAAGFGSMILNTRKSKMIQKDFTTSVREFVKEMNKLSLKMGLKNTVFHNPHGMMNGNKSTVIDLGKLAYHALQVPLIEKIAGTMEFSTVIVNNQGYERNVTWKNTNKLLEKGYSGLKTGTTETAGFCLSSLLKDRGVEIVVTVLNCKGSENRWIDTEKLSHWALRNMMIIKEQIGNRNFGSSRRQKRKYIASMCQML